MIIPDVDAFGVPEPKLNANGVTALAPPPHGTSARGHIVDQMEMAVYTQPVVEPGRTFVLQVWAFLPEERREVDAEASRGVRRIPVGREGSLEVVRGSRLTAALEFADLRVEPQGKEFTWNSVRTSFGFDITPPPGTGPGLYAGTIKLLVGGLPIGKVVFDIDVGENRPRAARQHPRPSTTHMFRNGFASYASQDRDEVLARAQGLLAAGVRVFLDVVDLRSGSWPEQLEAEIESCDVFYLFWSIAAKDSSEVEKEWKVALGRRGIEVITPVPLQPPEVAPPPPGLSRLQFGDIYLRLRGSTNPG